MLSACSYVYANKFTACDRNVRLPNAFSETVMVSVGVSNSAAECFFRAGDEYERCLLPRRAANAEVIASLRQIYKGMNSCFSRTVLQQTCSWDNWALLMSRDVPDFISPEQWPPKSPDINLVDYKIWATMQQRVYQTDSNIELRQCQLNVWSSIEQLDVIDASIDQWRVRHKACVCPGGGSLEHKL